MLRRCSRGKAAGRRGVESGEREAETLAVGSLRSHSRRGRHACDTSTIVRRSACALLVIDHLGCGHEAAGDQEHNIIAAPCAVTPELRPVQLVAHGEVAATAALQVALLEAVVAGHDLGGALLAGGEEEAVVAVRFGLVRCGGRGRKRHDVRLVLRVLPCGKSGQRCCCCKEKVAAHAVVGVDCVGGLKSDLLLRRRRRHGEVGARRLNDIHGACVCVDFESEEVVRVRVVGMGVAGSGAQRLEIYMGVVRLTWVLNNGTADGTRSVICGWSGKAFGKRSACVQNVVEVLMDAVRQGNPITLCPSGLGWKTTSIRLTLTSRRSSAEAVRVWAGSCSKWAAKKSSLVACTSACVSMRLKG